MNEKILVIGDQMNFSTIFLGKQTSIQELINCQSDWFFPKRMFSEQWLSSQLLNSKKNLQCGRYGVGPGVAELLLTTACASHFGLLRTRFRNAT